jgi:hypothetical protein
MKGSKGNKGEKGGKGTFEVTQWDQIELQRIEYLRSILIFFQARKDLKVKKDTKATKVGQKCYLQLCSKR